VSLWRSPLDNPYWVVHVQACAPRSTSSPVFAFSDEFTLMLDDGGERRPLITWEREPWFESNAFHSGVIPPGQCKAGWLSYEVPNGTFPVALQHGPYRFDVRTSQTALRASS
jgi:hypothetical protein